MVLALVDVRNIEGDTEVSNKAHRLAAEIIENNLLHRLGGKVKTSLQDDFE